MYKLGKYELTNTWYKSIGKVETFWISRLLYRNYTGVYFGKSKLTFEEFSISLN